MIQLGGEQLNYSCLASCNEPAYPPILQYWPNVRAAAFHVSRDNVCSEHEGLISASVQQSLILPETRKT
jgi:hypothetical protein